MTLGIWLFVTIIGFAGNFVLALKSDEMVKSLCSGKVCIWRKDVIFMRSPQGRIQKIQIAVAGKLASYMDSYYFATVIEQIIQKSTEKKEGWRRPLGHPLNLPVVPMGLYNPVISVVIRQHPPSHACILWISNLDSIFFPFPAPQCSPFKYLSLWLLHPQSLPSNEQVPDTKQPTDQSCHTELFLTQLKTALDHKTEKVKF